MDKTRISYEACPLCDSTEFSLHLEADCTQHPLYWSAFPETIRWCRCHACGHFFTDGYFGDEALARLFSRTNQSQMAGHDIETQRYISARMIEKVLPYASQGNWLDIGFGNGSLLFTAEEFGFHPVGIELRQANVAALHHVGIEAYQADIASFGWRGAFDVISMADVLEHMAYPRQTLTSAHRLLGSKGVLFLSMPNMDSHVWKALDHSGSNPYWGELEHYHNFGRRRLCHLLADSGFEPVRYGVSERYRVCMEVIARKIV